MPLIAVKPFLDGKGRLIAAGDELPTDYDKPTLAHYTRLGLCAEGKAPRAPRKPAGPNETKPAEAPEAKAADVQAEALDTSAAAAADPAAE